jgi:xanthine dehydrogenase accessory factor
VRHDSAAGSLGSDALEAVVAEDAADLLAAGTSASLSYGPDGQRGEVGVGVFAACYGRRPRMLVFGATDFAAALARLGSFLGYAVTVCDARSVFATAARFPDVDELVVDWPHRYLAAEVAAGRVDSRTVLCVLTHDAKFDLPLLELALTLPEVGYLGLMGSRRTVAERERQLRERGSDDAQLARLTRPIGLDLGARTPEETAVSIAAEIISLREGRGGQRLVDLDGRIHSPLQTMGRESRP